MPLIRSSIPMKPLIDDTYTRVVTLNSSTARQDYVDYTLPQSIDPTKCIAVINRKIGWYLSTSQRAYGIGLLAELTGANNLRLWVGGSAKSDTAGYYSFDIPIVIYQLGMRPKRIETIMSAANGADESISLSSSVDLSRSVIIGGSVGQINFGGTCYFNNSNSVFLDYSIGCLVVEF